MGQPLWYDILIYKKWYSTNSTKFLSIRKVICQLFKKYVEICHQLWYDTIYK